MSKNGPGDHSTLHSFAGATVIWLASAIGRFRPALPTRPYFARPAPYPLSYIPPLCFIDATEPGD
ncbi:hypothetical protein FHR22_003379 [Sphingopyxis panaciterrae]|nr:hypothetical protein [Sphingopyxis panaciterrae]